MRQGRKDVLDLERRTERRQRGAGARRRRGCSGARCLPAAVNAVMMQMRQLVLQPPDGNPRAPPEQTPMRRPMNPEDRSAFFEKEGASPMACLDFGRAWRVGGQEVSRCGT